MKKQDMYVVLLYVKVKADDPFYSGEARALECFMFEGRQPNEEDLSRLKKWYLHEMYPSEQEEDLVCVVRGSRPSQFECPADFIMSRYIDSE